MAEGSVQVTFKEEGVPIGEVMEIGSGQPEMIGCVVSRSKPRVIKSEIEIYSIW